MRVNEFSVRVIGGKEVDSGYVQMGQGQQYSLRLSNHRSVACDAKVEIDGKEVGTFRLHANDSMMLERSPNDHGKFTFYRAGSEEADKVGIADLPDDVRGLVKITFTPERVREVRRYYFPHELPRPTRPEPWRITYDNVSTFTADNTTCYSDSSKGLCGISGAKGSSSGPASFESGGTGLSGHSDQSFHYVDSLHYDLSGQTVIHLRLVYKCTDEPRPLVSHTTPIPPPVR